MTIQLTVEEKTTVVNQHLKTLAYAEYNATLSLALEEAASVPNTDKVTSLNSQLEDITSQRLVLQSELNSLA
jgi:hypothetical protein